MAYIYQDNRKRFLVVDSSLEIGSLPWGSGLTALIYVGRVADNSNIRKLHQEYDPTNSNGSLHCLYLNPDQLHTLVKEDIKYRQDTLASLEREHNKNKQGNLMLDKLKKELTELSELIKSLSDI